MAIKIHTLKSEVSRCPSQHLTAGPPRCTSVHVRRRGLVTEVYTGAGVKERAVTEVYTSAGEEERVVVTEVYTSAGEEDRAVVTEVYTSAGEEERACHRGVHQCR